MPSSETGRALGSSWTSSRSDFIFLAIASLTALPTWRCAERKSIALSMLMRVASAVAFVKLSAALCNILSGRGFA